MSRIINSVHAHYLRTQIEAPDLRRRKTALQQLCKLYRNGMSLLPEPRNAMEVTLLGLVHIDKSDEKVRRWLLNALARVGREENCLASVKHLLLKFHNEPQTVAAGIAAIYKLCKRRSPEDVLRTLSFDPQMQVLAALQHAPPNKLDLTSLPLNVETASPDLLQLALLVVGLGRSPENLLNPRYSDAEMVRVLGGHDHSTVSQYSVWAITENRKLGIVNLGIDVRDIESQPTNVRAWIFQLLALNVKDARTHFQILLLGMDDHEVEARCGLALGLRDTFLDILEPVVLDWLVNEDDAEVRQLLLDHLVRQSDKSLHYANFAKELFEKEPLGSPTRKRMEASAAGMLLYQQFKQIEHDGADLFTGVKNVTINHNTYNHNGNNQGGSVAPFGTAENSGASTVQYYTSEITWAIRTQLSDLERAVHDSSLEMPIKKEIFEQIEAARASTGPDTLQKVVNAINRTAALVEAGKVLAPYAVLIAKAAGLM